MNRCRHTRLSGHRCTTPALDDHPFCYYHRQHRRTPAPRPAHNFIVPPAVQIPALDTREAIQYVLHQVLTHAATGTNDLKRTRQMLYTLQIASSLVRLQERTRPAPGPDSSQGVPTEAAPGAVHLPIADEELDPIQPPSQIPLPPGPTQRQPTSAPGTPAASTRLVDSVPSPEPEPGDTALTLPTLQAAAARSQSPRPPSPDRAHAPSPKHTPPKARKQKQG